MSLASLRVVRTQGRTDAATTLAGLQALEAVIIT